MFSKASLNFALFKFGPQLIWYASEREGAYLLPLTYAMSSERKWQMGSPL
jgi:hypothetical protein